MDTAFLFLSYRRTQLYFAEALAYELAANGIRTWFDLQRLKPGANWKEAIQRGLDNCSGVIFVASKSALESPHVELEWRHALETGKPIYVVLFEDVHLPPELQQASIFSADRPFPDLIKQLVECVQTGKVPEKPPRRFRLFPMAMREDARWVGLLLLADGAIFVLMGLVTANAYFFKAPDHWVNVLYRMAIPFTDRINFNWIPFLIGAAILWGFWSFWRRRGSSMWGVALILAVVGLSFLIVSLAAWAASGHPVFEAGRPLMQFLSAAGVGLGILNGLYLVKLVRGSSAVLRWLSTGGAAAEYRQAIYKRLPGQQAISRTTINYRLEYAPEDRDLGEAVRSVMKAYGHREIRESQPDTLCLVLITHRMQPNMVEKLIARYPRFVPILAGQVDMSQYSAIEPYQIVDYRLREAPILNGMAAYFAEPTMGGFALGRVITPRAIDRANLMMRYSELDRSEGIRGGVLYFTKTVMGCLGQVVMVLLCFFAGGFGMSVFNMATNTNIPNSLRDLASPQPTLQYTSTPRPTVTPLPPLLVDIDGMQFDLPGEWSAVTDFAAEPYKTMLQDHKGIEVIWGGTDNDALWMVALNYPSLEAVTALWTAVGDGARQSLEVGYPVEWFMRDHTTVTVLRGQTEWLAAVEAHENIIVFHVLGGGEWGFSETLPDGIVDFITSAG